MKILVDMNLSAKWVDFFKKKDINAVHWSFIGASDAPDIEIFKYAKTHDYIIFTNDLDFGFILAITHGRKPSVIQTRTGLLGHDRIGDIVFSAITLLSSDLEKGALVTIDQNKTRVSLLPL